MTGRGEPLPPAGAARMDIARRSCDAKKGGNGAAGIRPHGEAPKGTRRGALESASMGWLMAALALKAMGPPFRPPRTARRWWPGRPGRGNPPGADLHPPPGRAVCDGAAFTGRTPDSPRP